MADLFWVIFRWHSAGTFDCASRTGGPFGTMRFDAEQAHGANSGIHIALRLLEPIREQFPTISHADFHQVHDLRTDLFNDNSRICDSNSLCPLVWHRLFSLLVLLASKLLVVLKFLSTLEERLVIDVDLYDAFKVVICLMGWENVLCFLFRDDYVKNVAILSQLAILKHEIGIGGGNVVRLDWNPIINMNIILSGQAPATSRGSSSWCYKGLWPLERSLW